MTAQVSAWKERGINPKDIKCESSLFWGIRALSLEARPGKVWFSLVQLGFGMARYSSVHYPWGGKGRRGQEADRVAQVGGQGVTGRAPWLEPLALVGNQTVFTHTHIHTKVQTYRNTEIHKHNSSKA